MWGTASFEVLNTTAQCLIKLGRIVFCVCALIGKLTFFVTDVQKVFFSPYTDFVFLY